MTFQLFARLLLVLPIAALRLASDEAFVEKASATCDNGKCIMSDNIALTLSGNGCLSVTLQLGFWRALMPFMHDKIKIISTNSGGSWITSSVLYTPEKRSPLTNHDWVEYLDGSSKNTYIFGKSCMTEYLLNGQNRKELEKCAECSGEKDLGTNEHGPVTGCEYGKIDADELKSKLGVAVGCVRMPALTQAEKDQINATIQKQRDSNAVNSLGETFALQTYQQFFKPNGIAADTQLQDLPVPTVNFAPEWAICEARYNTNYGRFGKDLSDFVHVQSISVSPTILHNTNKMLYAPFLADELFSETSLLFNVMQSSLALGALMMDVVRTSEAFMSMTNPFQPPVLISPTAYHLKNTTLPNNVDSVSVDCATIENSGIIPALYRMEQLGPAAKPGSIWSVISDNHFALIKSFLTDRVPYWFQVEPIVGDANNAFPDTIGPNDPLSITNPNHIIALVDRYGESLDIAVVTSFLKNCFAFNKGTCILRVAVLANSFWQLSGGFTTYLILNQLVADTSADWLLSILPNDYRNFLDSKSFPSVSAADEISGANGHNYLMNMPYVVAWSYIQLGSILGLNTMCRLAAIHKEPPPEAPDPKRVTFNAICKSLLRALKAAAR